MRILCKLLILIGLFLLLVVIGNTGSVFNRSKEKEEQSRVDTQYYKKVSEMLASGILLDVMLAVYLIFKLCTM